MSLMCIANPNVFRNVYSVMKPGPFRYIGGWLRRFRFLAATSRDANGEGFVKRVTDQLAGQPFKLMISPKGTRGLAEWRSGYYWIGAELGASFAVVGLDYVLKKLVVSSVYPLGERTSLERMLKTEMSEIVPLYPDLETCRVRGSCPSVIDWCTLSTIVASVACLSRGLRFKWYVLVAGCLASWFSAQYHRSRESSRTYRYLDLVSSWVGLLLYVGGHARGLTYQFWCLLGLSGALYWAGSGREQMRERTSRYTLCHSLFHLAMAVTLIYGVSC